MTDWEADSDRLRENLRRVLVDARRSARQRSKPSVEQARDWHREIMLGLATPETGVVGSFRGEPGLEVYEVAIGDACGTPSASVADELGRFEDKLGQAVDVLDLLIPPEQALTADELAAVIGLCAWAHGEWVRIHPFGNGNGRTARLWANAIGMRYGLPPFVRLRPRPDDDYALAAAEAMAGRWENAVPVFRQMLQEALGR